MAKKKLYTPSSVTLGENLERLRLQRDMTRLQLGKKVNAKEQQIAKFEQGEFIPLPMLEKIGLALDDQIPKKVIRKISSLREKAKMEGEESEELQRLCAKVFLGDSVPEDYF